MKVVNSSVWWRVVEEMKYEGSDEKSVRGGGGKRVVDVEGGARPKDESL